MAFAFEPKAAQDFPIALVSTSSFSPRQTRPMPRTARLIATALSRRRQKSPLSDSIGNTSVSKSRDVPLFPLPMLALQESPKLGKPPLAIHRFATSCARRLNEKILRSFNLSLLYAKQRDGILLGLKAGRSTLPNGRSSPRSPAARSRGLQLLDPRMNCRRILKCEIRRCPSRSPASSRTSDWRANPNNFSHGRPRPVFVICAALETRRQAHLHLGINASGKRGVGMQLVHAPPHFEKVQRVIQEVLGRCSP